VYTEDVGSSILSPPTIFSFHAVAVFDRFAPERAPESRRRAAALANTDVFDSFISRLFLASPGPAMALATACDVQSCLRTLRVRGARNFKPIFPSSKQSHKERFVLLD
ncbi:MAG: hypothetical protein KDJ62_01680, partial [Rhodobiaceae bacterium]|nr:hypothetical protein [Rhodobiaceae bacterium]